MYRTNRDAGSTCFEGSNYTIDDIVLTRVNALVLFQKTRQKNVYELSPPLVSLPMFHYVHKKNIHLVPKLTKVLKEMEKDGAIEKLRQQALGKFLE